MRKSILTTLLMVLLVVTPAAAQFTLPGLYSPGDIGAGVGGDGRDRRGGRHSGVQD